MDVLEPWHREGISIPDGFCGDIMQDELMSRGCCNVGNAESVRPVVSRAKPAWCKRLQDLVWNGEASDTEKRKRKEKVR